jgi:hypothetical protein
MNTRCVSQFTEWGGRGRMGERRLASIQGLYIGRRNLLKNSMTPAYFVTGYLLGTLGWSPHNFARPLMVALDGLSRIPFEI